MSTERKLRIVVVGMGFGQEFVPLYQRHPGVEEVGIAELDRELLHAVGEEHGVARRLESFESVLAEEGWDAVHIVTPPTMHAAQSVAAMRAGLDVACAIPAGVTVAELEQLVQTQRQTGRNYMMMETAVYSREFLFVKDLHERGELGRVQFLRGAHYQDMSGWPDPWPGFPPMNSSTHALGPLLHLTGGHATSVSAAGSGTMAAELRARHGNPFPIETATFRLGGPQLEDVVAEVTRTLFETAVAFEESFDVYGDLASFIWGAEARGERHAVVRMGPLGTEPGRPEIVEHPRIPLRPDLLPPELAAGGNEEHGGSHPHLVHEFVSSVVERRRPSVDASRAARWTAPGLLAHESALAGGALLPVPLFADSAEPTY
ncbi:MAG TPA: Gfo/Idh/MocA family oxidoreductase [Solirubrobacterales bacterium]|nr:Gfo/Idh/MocA family oxidoreductase [Solirubrobacterales bacterium]